MGILKETPTLEPQQQHQCSENVAKHQHSENVTHVTKHQCLENVSKLQSSENASKNQCAKNDDEHQCAENGNKQQCSENGNKHQCSNNVTTSTEPFAVITIVLQILRDKNQQTRPPDDVVLQTEKEMTSVWRVVSFFIVIFVLPTILISVPLYARYHLYKAQHLSSTDGDMLSLHSEVSTFWCQGQRVISNGTFEAYVTPKARRLKRRRRMSHLSSELLLTHDDAEEWGVHLIKGSRFSFSACARWPGGTLIVVKGEENLRKCFYKEERLREELNKDSQKPPPVDPSPVPNKEEVPGGTTPGAATNVASGTTDYDQGGGEVVDENENDVPLSDDIKRRLYSQENDVNRSDVTDQPFEEERKKPHVKKLVEMKKKVINKVRRDKPKEPYPNPSPPPQTTPPKIVSKDFLPQQENEEMIKVHKGTFFFNANDTKDVKTGNSSFSSSEEFMRQCSDTISTIELTPYINCPEIASINNTNGPDYRRFVVNQTDFYYFIFTSDNSIEANVISFRLLIERTLYNTSAPMEKCTSNNSECQFSFEFLRSAGVIVDFSTYANVSKMEDLHTYELTAICQPRTFVYTIFILMVPFIIILFAFR